MANKTLYFGNLLTNDVSSLEVYRDISMDATLNQANIWKSYKEIIPLCLLGALYLSSDLQQNRILCDEVSTMLGSLSSRFGFNTTTYGIEVQVSDAYYVEVYNSDVSSLYTLLQTEPNNEQSAIYTEKNTPFSNDNKPIALFQNEGQVSAFQNYKESLMWNPYKLEKLVNVKSVLNSINNIFTWMPGERILNPEFGSNLRKMLYLGILDYNAEQIIAEIRRCMSEYEPRALILKISNVSDVNDTENNTIKIEILFTIPSLSEELYAYTYTYNKVSE